MSDALNWLNKSLLNEKVNLAKEYFAFDISGYEALLKNTSENFWQSAGAKKALQLFHTAAELVPAYKDFLKKNKIAHQKIINLSDFSQVPITDKQNYIQNYKVKDRCWKGDLSHSTLTAVSSGTTGHPNFWPRGGLQEIEAAVTHELIYKNFFQIDKYKTLLVIGFPMGVYVSGMATVLPSWLVAQKGYPLTIVSAGNNKAEVLKTVRQLGKEYQQIILVGHPFFIKDVIETGKQDGINWKARRLRMMLCSEGFSEAWRAHLAKEAGITDKAGIINTYGSSEMLLMAYETPTSIKIKQLMESGKLLPQNLIGSSFIPNLFQYNPVLRFMETVNNELIFTSQSGLPLVRFNLHDHGATIPFSKIFDPKSKKNDVWELPFVALWGRSDYTIIFYAANIYPQHIHAALNHKLFFKKITGKFTLRKDYLKNMDEFLEIIIELRPGITPSGKLSKKIQLQAIETLRKLNLEYDFLCNHLDKDLTPRIRLLSYQNEKYFKPGLKPKYILQ